MEKQKFLLRQLIKDILLYILLFLCIIYTSMALIYTYKDIKNDVNNEYVVNSNNRNHRESINDLNMFSDIIYNPYSLYQFEIGIDGNGVHNLAYLESSPGNFFIDLGEQIYGRELDGYMSFNFHLNSYYFEDIIADNILMFCRLRIGEVSIVDGFLDDSYEMSYETIEYTFWFNSISSETLYFTNSSEDSYHILDYGDNFINLYSNLDIYYEFNSFVMYNRFLSLNLDCMFLPFDDSFIDLINDPDNAYNLGYNKGYDLGYGKGYSDGAFNSINPIGNNFDDTSIVSQYFGESFNTGYGWYVDDSKKIPINGYTYDLTSYANELKTSVDVVEYISDTFDLRFAISNFTEFVDSNISYNLIGFDKIEITYNDGTSAFSNLDPFTYSNVNFDNNKLVNSILLYFKQNVNMQDGYILNLINNNSYQDGYQTGFSAGQLNGKDSVINNPGQYDLYNKADYELNYNNGYSQGYNKGVMEGEGLGERGFLTMFNAILNAPYNILNGMLNFEIFGINVVNVVFFILTIGVIIFVLSLFLGKK